MPCSLRSQSTVTALVVVGWWPTSGLVGLHAEEVREKWRLVGDLGIAISVSAKDLSEIAALDDNTSHDIVHVCVW